MLRPWRLLTIPGIVSFGAFGEFCAGYQDRKNKDVRGSDMEKVKFAFADGNGEDEFLYLKNKDQRERVYSCCGVGG